MRARLGIAPIAWSNDDLPELGGDTSLETCLAEAKRAGFSGIETGGKFPRTAGELGPILERHGLALCGGWFSGKLLGGDVESERDRMAWQLELFRDLGAPCIVYGETSGTIQGDRTAPLDTRRRLDEGQIKSYAQKATELALWCHDQGMPMSFHHHMGTAIESESDVDLLMRHSGPELGLLYDPGHMAFARGDVLGVAARHADRISHFHAKDVRMEVVEGLDRSRESFLGAVLKGVFTVPGDGALDFGALARILADRGYEGWFVVEAEQDPKKAPPLEYACKGYESLAASVRGAGYTIEE